MKVVFCTLSYVHLRSFKKKKRKEKKIEYDTNVYKQEKGED